MIVAPVACDLWFGCLFPESFFWDFDLNRLSPDFQKHLTESFKTDLKHDMGEVVFTGLSRNKEAVEEDIIHALQDTFDKQTDKYLGLQVKSLTVPLSGGPVSSVFFGWDFLTIKFSLDADTEKRLRHFFAAGVSGLSVPVLLNTG
jgi:hypothetical protein